MKRSVSRLIVLPVDAIERSKIHQPMPFAAQLGVVSMTYSAIIPVVLAAALTLSGCAGGTAASRTATGAAAGAAAGALIGSNSANAGKGALIGAGVGAAGGYLYDQHQKEIEQRERYRHYR